MESRPSLTFHRRLLPAFVGGVIAVGAIGGFFAARAAERAPSDDAVQSFASVVASTISARLEADGQRLTAIAASLGGAADQPDQQLNAALRRDMPADGRWLGVVRLQADGSLSLAAAVRAGSDPAVDANQLLSQPDWRLALDLVRDEGGSRVVVGGGSGENAIALEAAPLFGKLAVPADLATRRAALQGFVVALAPVGRIVDFSAAGSDVSVQVNQGSVRLVGHGRGAAGDAPASATALPVTASGADLTVRAWPTAPASSWPWAVLGGGLILAAVATVIVRSRERSIDAAVAETTARSQELDLIARTGPLLQQSLALGDLLPTFVVEVGDELGLESISIGLVTDAGELLPAFSLGGEPSDAAVDPMLTIEPPESVAPGERVVIPLQRLGRAVGVFEAKANAGLTSAQMATLRAVCALLAAAVGNVKLFQDEQDLVARLREVDRMKTSFVGAVSHELRTSVTAIQGFSSLLEADGSSIDDALRADYTARISRNAKSLSVLVEDLLDFARFQRVGFLATLRPVDLSDLVPNVVDQMSSVLDGRPVVLDVEPNVIAIADNHAVERILVNLLSNAANYTPEGSEVTVELERGDAVASLSISDRGPGIPVSEREKIFELFYRSRQSAANTRGIGIGLALARELASHLAGTIEVDEAPGGGARFRVALPLADETMLGGV